MSPSSDRTAEIWSTRLQRELLTLTTDTPAAPPPAPSKDAASNDEEDDDAGSEATPKHDNLSISDLPPFVQVKDHALDIAGGICKVTFIVDVVVKKEKEVGAGGGEDGEGEAGAPDGKGEEGKKEEDAEGGEGKTDGEGGAEGGEESSNAAAATPHVLVTLDASMPSGANSSSQPVCYPFQMPKVILTSGADLFSPKSTIQNGDYIDLDCDWTPSLHLSDAALNVALKIRESIKRGDAFFPSVDTAVAKAKAADPDDANRATISNLLTGGKSLFPTDFKVSIPSMSTKKKDSGGGGGAAAASSGATGGSTAAAAKAAPVKKKANKHPSIIQIGEAIDLSSPPYSVCVGMFSCKAIRRPEFVEKAIAEAAAKDESLKKARELEEDSEDEGGPPVEPGPGNYMSMKLHAGSIRKVAGVGFAGAGQFFKSITAQAKAALEESFLMITQDHILELRSSKLSIDTATVTFISPISLLAKLKFRREESVSLFFKQAPDDPLILMCPDSADAVAQIQSVLKRHGVKGKHTNAATQRQIQLALQLVMQIQAKENTLEKEPTTERVQEIMDLYRQAAEKFETAGDARHEEVMSHMHKFLAKDMTMKILDGSYKPTPGGSATIVSVPKSPKRKGGTDEFDDDDGLSKEVAMLSGGPGSPSPQKGVDRGYEDTMKTANDILDEVEKLGMDDDDLDDFLSSAASSGGGGGGSGSPVSSSGDGGSGATDTKTATTTHSTDDEEHDPVAELDAMLSAANEELNDIIDSK